MPGLSRSALVFGATSLAAVTAGCVAMAGAGVGRSTWVRSFAAWAIGAVLAALLVRYGRPRSASIAAVVIGNAALIATLFATPVDGVHRWLDIGPLHINAAALFVPPLIVAVGAIGVATPSGMVAALIAAAVLLAQPDASQLTGFVLAALLLLACSAATIRGKRLAIIIGAIAVVAGWMRPDPLQPVAEAEQIFTMSVSLSPLLAAFAALALAGAVIAPVATLPQSGQSARDSAVALSAYFVAISIAPFFGWFPVPLVGLGMSFPLGWWLGMAMLDVLSQRAAIVLHEE